MLCVLGLLTVVALLGSALPVWLGAGLSVCSLGYAGWTVHRYLGQSPRVLVIPGGALPALLDDVVLTRFSLQWRGPLAFASWQDVRGGRGHLAWWPDTLDARQRRELRLAVGEGAVSVAMATMAP